ncbi:MAG: hypothetical protein JRI68_10960 [Deltaproteobacteria bacterium]|nr:hypothetical protein [Deltaproteobacteria bacterium]
MTPPELAFSDQGPFDEEERVVIRKVVAAVAAAELPGAATLLGAVSQSVALLERLGAVLCSYPSLFTEQSLGSKRRSLESLVQMLSRADPSNFDMFLPTRALLSRDLVMAEMNFYRLLRVVCTEALGEQERSLLMPGVDRQLCHCLYTRLAQEVLTHIASDRHVNHDVREKAVLSLTHIWEQITYRVSDFFPVLEATWEARRQAPVTLGTLMGTAEMFRLIEAGCDEQFVDYLVRPTHSEDEAAAFREFLFGATTEQLERMQARMASMGKHVIGTEDLELDERVRDACTLGGDPALAMFEFFLSRHLQADARRHADIPGPKRTAEEYVMLHYLESTLDKRTLSVPPPPRE